MITPTVFLDPGLALRAFPKPKLFVEPFLLCRVALNSAFLTGEARMRFLIASRTYCRETRWTLQLCRLRLPSIDLLTIRSRAILVLLWVLVKVVSKRDFN